MPESLQEFLEKAATFDISEEERDKELKLQFDIDMGALKRDFFKYREPTFTEKAAAIPTRVGGVIGGAVKGVAEPIAEAYLEQAGLTIPKELKVSKRAEETVKETEAHLEKTIEERLGQDGIENLRSDLTDLVEGVYELGRMLVVAEDRIPAVTTSTEFLTKTFEDAVDFGKEFTWAAVTDLHGLMTKPKEYFIARPATTALIVAPLIARAKHLAQAGYEPAQVFLKSDMAEVMGETFSEAKRSIESGVGRYSKKLKRGFEEVAPRTARAAKKGAIAVESTIESGKRLLRDPYEVGAENATRILEDILADKSGQSVEAISKRYAERVLKGEDITPKEVRRQIDYTTPSQLTPAQIKLRDALATRKKVPTVEEIEAGILPIGAERVGEIPLIKYYYEPETNRFGLPKESQQAIASIRTTLEDQMASGQLGLPLDLEEAVISKIEKRVRAAGKKPVGVDIAESFELGKLFGPERAFIADYISDLFSVSTLDVPETLNIIGHHLSKAAVGTLKSPKLRAAVVERIVGSPRFHMYLDDAKVQTADIKHMKKADLGKVRFEPKLRPIQLVRLKESLNKFLLELTEKPEGSATHDYNAIIDIEGVPYNIPNTVRDVMVELADKKVFPWSARFESIVNGQALLEAGREIKALSEAKRLKEVAKKWLSKTEMPGQFADELIDTVISEGKEVPALIPHNPHIVAQNLIDAIDLYAAKIRKPGWTNQQKIDAVRDLAYKIRSYKRMPETLTSTYGLRDYLQEIHPKPIDPVSKVTYEVFAPEGVIEAMGWEQKALAAVEQPSLWMEVVKSVKANLTARNLSTNFNNVFANFAYQTLRRADPLLAKDLIVGAAKHRAFKLGKKLKPWEQDFFKAMERTGVIDSSLVDAELGGFSRSGLVRRLLGDTKLGYIPEKLAEYQERAYKYGDTLFKLEETMHNYRKMLDDIAVLKEGEYINVSVSPRQRVKIVKDSEAGSGYTIDGVDTGRVALNDALTKASAQPALDIFFDYGEVPNLIKWVRSSRALGISSPFFTWFFKAVDIPFVKRGLLTNLFYDGIRYDTNSSVLHGRQRKTAVRNSIRSGYVINGLRDSIIEPVDDDALRKVLAYAPKEFNLQLLNTTTNPFWIGHDSIESANQFGPTDIIFRLLQSGRIWTDNLWGLLGEGFSLEELYPSDKSKPAKLNLGLENVDPEERKDILERRGLWKKHIGGQKWTASDLGKLVGLAGSPLMDAVIIMKETEKAGKKIDKARLAQTFGAMLLGGTVYRVADIGLGAIPVTAEVLDVPVGKYATAYSTRRWAESPVGAPQEEFIRWAMRRVTGVGYRPLDIMKRKERYFTSLKKEWNLALTEDLKKQLEDPLITPEETNNITARIFELEEIIDSEITLEQLRFDEVYSKIDKVMKK